MIATVTLFKKTGKYGYDTINNGTNPVTVELQYDGRKTITHAICALLDNVKTSTDETIKTKYKVCYTKSHGIFVVNA